MIGLISRLTDQKGLDLINYVIDRIVDDYTQLVVIGTGIRLMKICSAIMHGNTATAFLQISVIPMIWHTSCMQAQMHF